MRGVRTPDPGGTRKRHRFFLIVRQYDLSWYQWVVQAESFLAMRYKLDPIAMERGMTMLDFQTLIQQIETQVKEDQKDDKGNRVMKSLVAIRDILNYMTLNENK